MARATSSGARARDEAEAEDEDEDGLDDEFAESFYVGETECACDVMIIDEDEHEPRVVREENVDVRTLRREMEEDAMAVMTLLLTNEGKSKAVARARGTLPKSMSHCELSVALCSDEYIRSLNAGYREKDSATDVLSFPAESFGPMAVLGDVIVSVDTASAQAREVGHSLRDECRVLLVHGTLHLLGMDHEVSESEAEVMAAAEQEVLKALGWKVTGLTRRASGESTSDSSSTTLTTQRSVLVTDLDGTLLNENSVITPRVADALRRAMASGVEVVVATGKARPAAIKAAATQGLDGIIVGKNTPGVFLQGLEVYGRGGALVYEAKMPEDVTRDAFMMMDDVVHDGLALTAFCGDNCATLAPSVLLDELHHTYHEPASEIAGSVDEILSNNTVRKLLLMGPSKESIDGVRSIWEAAFRGRAEVTQAVADMLEILPLGNDKSKGVRAVLKSMDVNPMTDVVAIGDGENDAEMLRFVGCGVAMANATEKTKSGAAHVLDASNTQDGVAEAIDRFVL
jgi:rRNA maturation RNase YbeY